MDWIVPIVVALLGGPIVVLLQRSRKENSSDHAIVMDKLDKIDSKVDKVDGKVDKHIEWHLGARKKKEAK